MFRHRQAGKFGHAPQAAHTGDRHDARDLRDAHPGQLRTATELQEVFCLEKQLTDGQVCSAALFGQQYVEVLVVGACLIVAVRVAGDGNGEPASGKTCCLAAFDLADQAYELVGMLQVIGRQSDIAFGQVTAQCQQPAHTRIDQAVNPGDHFLFGTRGAREVGQGAHVGFPVDAGDELRGAIQPAGAVRAGDRDIVGAIRFQRCQEV